MTLQTNVEYLGLIGKKKSYNINLYISKYILYFSVVRVSLHVQ